MATSSKVALFEDIFEVTALNTDASESIVFKPLVQPLNLLCLWILIGLKLFQSILERVKLRYDMHLKMLQQMPRQIRSLDVTALLGRVNE
jgi:hypothetical protein